MGLVLRVDPGRAVLPGARVCDHGALADLVPAPMGAQPNLSSLNRRTKSEATSSSARGRAITVQ
jgi:hypothetical protein